MCTIFISLFGHTGHIVLIGKRKIISSGLFIYLFIYLLVRFYLYFFGHKCVWFCNKKANCKRQVAISLLIILLNVSLLCGL